MAETTLMGRFRTPTIPEKVLQLELHQQPLVKLKMMAFCLISLRTKLWTARELSTNCLESMTCSRHPLLQCLLTLRKRTCLVDPRPRPVHQLDRWTVFWKRPMVCLQRDDNLLSFDRFFLGFMPPSSRPPSQPSALTSSSSLASGPGSSSASSGSQQQKDPALNESDYQVERRRLQLQLMKEKVIWFSKMAFFCG